MPSLNGRFSQESPLVKNPSLLSWVSEEHETSKNFTEGILLGSCLEMQKVDTYHLSRYVVDMFYCYILVTCTCYETIRSLVEGILFDSLLQMLSCMYKCIAVKKGHNFSISNVNTPQ